MFTPKKSVILEFSGQRISNALVRNRGSDNNFGVVFFMGPKTNPSFYNESLYRKGEGIFPVPLAGAVDLLADPSGDVVPDLQVEDHPVVSV